MAREPLPDRIGPLVRVHGGRFRLREGENVELVLDDVRAWSRVRKNPSRLLFLAPAMTDALGRVTRHLTPSAPIALAGAVLALTDMLPIPVRVIAIACGVALFAMADFRARARQRLVFHLDGDVVVADPLGQLAPVSIGRPTWVEACATSALPEHVEADATLAFALRFDLPDGNAIAIQPARYDAPLSLPALVSAAFAMRVALGLQRLPPDDAIEKLLPMPRVSAPSPDEPDAPLIRGDCLHSVDALAPEGGPLELLRCPSCRGAHMPSHAAHRLVTERLGLSPGDVEDLASAFAGRAFSCAECGGRTRPIRLLGVVVDVCRGCGAMWLDANEEEAFFSLFDASVLPT